MQVVAVKQCWSNEVDTRADDDITAPDVIALANPASDCNFVDFRSGLQVSNQRIHWV
jgi:hypothetical protein